MLSHSQSPRVTADRSRQQVNGSSNQRFVARGSGPDTIYKPRRPPPSGSMNGQEPETEGRIQYNLPTDSRVQNTLQALEDPNGRAREAQNKEVHASLMFVPQPPPRIIVSTAEGQMNQVQGAIESVNRQQNPEPFEQQIQMPQPAAVATFGQLGGRPGWNFDTGFKEMTPGLTITGTDGCHDHKGDAVGHMPGFLVHVRKTEVNGGYTAGILWEYSKQVTYIQPTDVVPNGVVTTKQDLEEVAYWRTRCEEEDNGGRHSNIRGQEEASRLERVADPIRTDMGPQAVSNSKRVNSSNAGSQETHASNQSQQRQYMDLMNSVQMRPQLEEATNEGPRTTGVNTPKIMAADDDGWENDLDGQQAMQTGMQQHAVARAPRARMFPGASNRTVFSGSVEDRSKLQTPETEENIKMLSSYMPDLHEDVPLYPEDLPDKRLYLTAVSAMHEVYEAGNRPTEKEYARVMLCCSVNKIRKCDVSRDNPQTVKAAVIFPSMAESEHKNILNFNKNGHQSSLVAKYIGVEVPEADSPEDQQYQQQGGFMKFMVPTRVRSRVPFENGQSFYLVRLRGCFKVQYYQDGDQFLKDDPVCPELSVPIREKAVLDDSSENRTHTDNHTMLVLIPAVHAFTSVMETITSNRADSPEGIKLPAYLRQFCVPRRRQAYRGDRFC